MTWPNLMPVCLPWRGNLLCKEESSRNSRQLLLARPLANLAKRGPIFLFLFRGIGIREI